MYAFQLAEIAIFLRAAFEATSPPRRGELEVSLYGMTVGWVFFTHYFSLLRKIKRERCFYNHHFHCSFLFIG